MPYDPKDPSDYVLTASEKFEYDNNGNLIKSIIVSKHNDVIKTYIRRKLLLEIMTMPRNPLKSFIY